ncbi:MAG: replication initiation protein, partial [Desulfamplus sp.]|nr:replication initiation protein [Desulfamplus sp.]
MNDKALIIKANQLIEAKYKLSLSEQKIVLNYISKIKPGDDDFQEYSFTVDEIRDALGLSKKTKSLYEDLYQLSEQIFSKPLGMKDEKGFVFFNWFSKIRFDGSTLTLRSDPDLKPYLLQLKSHFTKYQLKNVIRLKSIYAIRIYELMKQYEKIGCRKFNLEELKELLGIKGKYEQFFNFRKRVLEPAERELNEFTDLCISYGHIKTGKKVTGIEFIIERQSPQRDISQPEENKPPQTIVDLIPQEHQKSCQKLCQQIFTKDGTEGLKFYIGKCNSRKQTPNGSYSGYLKTVFDLDLYADVKEALEAKAMAQKETQEMRQQALEAQKKQKMQQQEEQAALKARHEALERLQAEDPDRYDQLEQQAADALELNL